MFEYEEPGKNKFMVVEAADEDLTDLARYYGTEQSFEANMPFNFKLMDYTIKNNFTEYNAFEILNVIESWLKMQDFSRTYKHGLD